MVEFERTPATDGNNSSLRICVAGVGGAGSNVIDRVTVDRTLNATLVSLQTDVRVLNQSMAPRKVQLGAELMRGVGTGGDPDLGREAAIYSKDRIRESLEGHDMVFISVGLGGGTGSGAAPVVAEIAKSLGAIVVVFAAVPFSFEGRRRIQQAQEALDRLQKSSDALILFDNNRMGELVLGKEGIQKTFAQADSLIGQSVRAVSAMVGQPGLVKLGLDDLAAALKASDGRCLFGFGEAKGQNRGTEAMKRALKSPLINNGQLLNNARNLLVHIVGGDTLTLAEVESIMKQLGRHVPDETQLLFGIGVDSRMTDSISVTLISALSADQLATAEPAPMIDTGRVQLKPAASSYSQTAISAPVVAPPSSDLFGDPILTPSRAKVSAPEPEPEKEDEPVVSMDDEGDEPEPKPVAPVKAEAPPVQPAPQPIAPPRAREEEPVRVSAPPPLPKSGFSLASVISGGDGGSSSRSTTRASLTKEKEDTSRYAPQARAGAAAVVEPMAETAPVVVPARSTNIVTRQLNHVPAPAPQPVAVMEEVTNSFQLEPEPEPTDESSDSTEPVSATMTNPAAAAPASASKAASTSEEQVSLKLGGEDRGRFNGTDAAVVEGEDLDTPTWMRLRRNRGR
ncbi:MAG: cell division FtsZ family protein [Verrucomicrobiaceae bacterium]|nr:cell division FtsZ family protein [Verrucomicrobiaceae bacterium]